MANTENIEAKLAAYVDGELDAADRAEIEQHLAANPQHRKLIEELREARQCLRELPREQAPPEIAEMLNAQLERAALLGDVELGGTAGGGTEMRINRWPQIRAIAAILMLTLGLAGLIYWVLPSPKAPPQQVAVLTPESGATTDARLRATAPDDLIRAEGPAGGGAGGNALAMKPAKEESVAAAVPAPAESGAGRIIAPAETTANGKPTVGPEDGRKQVEAAKRDALAGPSNVEAQLPTAAGQLADAVDLDKLKTAESKTAESKTAELKTSELDKAFPPDAAASRGYLLVSAADTSQALGQVVRYLDENKIEYRNVAPAGAPSSTDAASQLGSTGDRGAFAPTPAEAEKSSPARADNKVSRSARSHAAGSDIYASRGVPTSMPEGEAMANGAAASNAPQVGTGAALPENRQPSAPGAAAAAVPPSTNPAEPEQSGLADANAPAAADREEQAKLRDKLQQAQAPSGDSIAPPGSQLLYARNITRQQAAALCSSITQPAANQVAQVVLPAPSQAPAAPATMPVDQSAPFQAGEALRCRLADGTVSETLNVDDDGNVNVPQLGVVRAAGLTPAQFGEYLTSKTSVAMQQVVTKDQGWSVERVAPEAGLANKFAKDAANLKVPATEPADQIATAPTTQSAGAIGPATGAEDRVDLVIVVRSAPQPDAGAKAPAIMDEKQATTPTTPPASQPADR